jgi:hypothetical protein
VEIYLEAIKMTLLEALPKVANNIEIPIGAKAGEDVYPGLVDPDWLSKVFADFVNKEVPLSDADYQALLDISSPNWKLNWQEFRKQGII